MSSVSSKELLCVCQVLFAIPDGYEMNNLVRSVRVDVALPCVAGATAGRQICTNGANGAICCVLMKLHRLLAVAHLWVNGENQG
jgi:hypothetical protein